MPTFAALCRLLLRLEGKKRATSGGQSTGANDVLTKDGVLGCRSALLRAERVAPSQPLEASEVAVSRDQFTAVLDSECGQVGIGHQRALDIGAESNKEIPMPPAGRNQGGPWALDELLAQGDRGFHWSRRIEDFWRW
jgi:hypothetical protein